MKKLSWGIAIAFALVLVAMLGLSRYKGAVLQGAGGRAIGYSGHTHEWLFGEYPTFPARRDGPYLLIDGNERTARDHPRNRGR